MRPYRQTVCPLGAKLKSANCSTHKQAKIEERRQGYEEGAKKDPETSNFWFLNSSSPFFLISWLLCKL
jgi:hypothetical protein